MINEGRWGLVSSLTQVRTQQSLSRFRARPPDWSLATSCMLCSADRLSIVYLHTFPIKRGITLSVWVARNFLTNFSAADAHKLSAGPLL